MERGSCWRCGKGRCMARIVTTISGPRFFDDHMAKDTAVSRYSLSPYINPWIIIQQRGIFLPKDDRISGRLIVQRTTQPDVRSFLHHYLCTFQYHWFRIWWLFIVVNIVKRGKRKKKGSLIRSEVTSWFWLVVDGRSSKLECTYRWLLELRYGSVVCGLNWELDTRKLLKIVDGVIIGKRITTSEKWSRITKVRSAEVKVSKKMRERGWNEPASVHLRSRISRIQSLEVGEWWARNLESLVYANKPDVKMCKSDCLTHETWSRWFEKKI